MSLAMLTGVPHTVWLDDPRALATALAILREQNRRRRRG